MSKNAFRLNYSLGLCWILLLAVASPEIVTAQVATPAPAVPPATDVRKPASQRTEAERAEKYLEMGKDFYEVGNLGGAIEMLRASLENTPLEEIQSERTLETALKFAEILLENGDYQRAIHVANSLKKFRPDSIRQQILRGAAYEKMNWTSAMLDELRSFVRQHPSDITFRAGLAMELAYSQVPPLRNSIEAKELLSKRNGHIETEPAAARLIAATEAKLGNFDKAVAMQKYYLESGYVAEADRDVQEGLFSLYQKNMVGPHRRIPTVEPSDLLSNEKLADIARSCTVIVRVMGAFECKESTTGETKVLGLSHEHIGTVLDTFGTLLVASETVRLPRYEDVKLLKGAGSTRWAQELYLEVFSLPTAKQESVSLGKAVLVGTDEESGVAVIQLSKDKPFTFTNIGAGYQAVQFEPEYRPFDKNSNLHLKKSFELKVDAIGSGNLPAINEVKMGENRVSAYIQWTTKMMTLTRSAYANGSSGPIGTPYFNELGECIGIKQVVGITQESLRPVAVPASTCTRVAAKLAAYGKVDRADLPIAIGAMFTDVKQPSSGMLVMHLMDENPIFKPLKGKYITSLDGTPTPSLTEWIAALERVASMGLETAVVEVFDKSTGLLTYMTIPLGRTTDWRTTNGPASNAKPNPDNAVKPTESISTSQSVLKVIESHLAKSVKKDHLADWDKLIKKASQDERNISFLFSGEMMSDGRPHAILLRDGEVVMNALAPRILKLDQLGSGMVRVIDFGNTRPKKEEALRLTNVKFIRSKAAKPQDELLAEIDISGVQSVRDNLYVRFQFVGTNVGPIYASLKDIPTPNTNVTVRIASELTALVRPKPWGGLCVVDIVQMRGAYALNDVSSVSNQWVDYVELTPPKITEELIDLDFTEAMMEIYK